ncbi:Ras-related protein Rab-4B [Tritrichomonas foetus]|uniref:Ras-related protein Rab-4B n=1 Tax=Tritrichomonas foetus TaxID=1144522 RepID=A0A1J4KBQ4_9EUKA|nr:Ras-related protein Rab-4B [Tritrichomonas foetus]|eukprot:OHT07124.1 Ras-related protein Rab-4B [Tritrichomonas foetus]
MNPFNFNSILSSMTQPLYKFIVIGSSGVGKTAIIKRLTENTFSDLIQSTIGVEFVSTLIQIGDDKVKLQIWDTAGQERFQSVSKSYYRNAVGVIIVYDITDRKSFDSLPTWINEVHQHCDPNAVVHLIGNKSDLNEERQISLAEATSFAESYQMNYIETSAKGGDNVTEAFVRAATDIISRGMTNSSQPATPQSQPIVVQGDESKKKCGC